MYVFRRQNSPFFYAGGQFSVNDNACRRAALVGAHCARPSVSVPVPALCAWHLKSVPGIFRLCLASSVCTWHLQSVSGIYRLCPQLALGACPCPCRLCLASKVCAWQLQSVPGNYSLRLASSVCTLRPPLQKKSFFEKLKSCHSTATKLI